MSKKIIELDQEDIRIIIAKYFGVKPGDVHVDCYIETLGYGINEQDFPGVKVFVNKDEHDMVRSLSEERCAMCGSVIPEGRQVCPMCEKG